MSPFKVIVGGVFVFFAILGVLFFAGFAGIGGGGERIGEVEVWGTVERAAFTAMKNAVGEEGPDLDGVSYTQKDARTYVEELTDALAAGRGPDLFFLRDEDVVRMEDKIQILPYDNYSERRFKDAFAEGGEVFLHQSGILALPVSVDPLVLYWNRNLLSSAGVAEAPRRWEEVITLSENLTRRDNSGNVLTATIPFGEFRNVTHAKELLVSLARQAGTPLVTRDEEGIPEVVTGVQAPSGEDAVSSVLRFYTEFSNPTKSVYTWNSAFDESRREFTAGDLALYPGRASELRGLREANPNLNFDVAQWPQASDSEQTTFGSFQGLAVPRAADNSSGAFQLAFLLSGSAPVAAYAEEVNLPPVRRDLLSETSNDAIGSVFYRSALIADSWLDPNPSESDAILEATIRDITSGRLRASGAAGNFTSALDRLFDNQ